MQRLDLIFIDISKGGKLYYQAYGSGKPIIVLHGGPGMSQNYLLPYMAELAKNHQVIFYDQRGSGKSIYGTIDDSTININQFVEDLENFRQKLGLNKITLIGHSWGGELAMHYAIKHPDHLHKLIIMNSLPANEIGIKAFIENYTKITAQVKPSLEKIEQNPKLKEGDAKLFEQYLKLIFSTYVKNEADVSKLNLSFTSNETKSYFEVSTIFAENFITKPFDIRPDLQKINVPTLVIHSDYDPIPLWTAKDIANSIKGAKFLLIKDCGHFPYIEKPDETFKVIEEFMQEVSR